jgi:hypothetical protein
VLFISSKKVGWAKQGTCKLVDDQPAPPSDPALESPQGWKEVTAFVAVTGGGDFQFPVDQLLVVTPTGEYKPIPGNANRTLGKLSATKNYLVWWHHLVQQHAWKAKHARPRG